MYNGILHAHSGFRYLILIGLVATIALAISGLSNKQTFEKKHKLLALFTMILCHLQLLFGILLMFTSPKVEAAYGAGMRLMMKQDMLRFYGMEHLVAMLAAIVLITIGYRKTKSAETPSNKKFRNLLIFYGLALVLIFAMIQWPFLRNFGAGWF